MMLRVALLLIFSTLAVADTAAEVLNVFTSDRKSVV